MIVGVAGSGMAPPVGVVLMESSTTVVDEPEESWFCGYVMVTVTFVTSAKFGCGLKHTGFCAQEKLRTMLKFVTFPTPVP